MPRGYYQYETSPRKYEPDYTRRKYTTSKKKEVKKKDVKKTKKESTLSKREIEKQKREKARAIKKAELKNKTLQLIVVIAIFGMLFTISYREISIMEMFNEKKNLESNLATITKENGQIEKDIEQVESTLDWNSIKQKATEGLGMQTKNAIPVDLERLDNVETHTKLIEDEKSSFIEKVLTYIINKI